MPSDTLVSVAILPSHGERPGSFLPKAEAYVRSRWPHHEVLVVLPGDRMSDAARWASALPHGSNARVLTVASGSGIDETEAAALSESLGDWVAVIRPSEITVEDLGALLTSAASGMDIVRVRLPTAGRSAFDRAVGRAVAGILTAVSGHRIRDDLARSFCISRSAATATLARRGEMPLLRHVETLWHGMSGGYVESTVASRRHGGIELRRRIATALAIATHSSGRLLAASAAACLASACASAGFGLYALLVNLFMDGVAQGWTSLAMAGAAAGTVVFSSLGILSIAMRHVMGSASARNVPRIAGETASIDITIRSAPLNVADDTGVHP